ncbi:MAG: ankyrin repeat domain-containing protein [Phycisphaerales bacterium]|nr:MAG: ankyrin repeat domain-containing protein [Phycisphaerales bacterium]
MRISLRTLAILLGLFALSVRGQQSQDGAFYQGLEPGAFMRQWLVCGPFPIFEDERNPGHEAVQEQAFHRDFLTQHGGEPNIVPTPQMVHEIEGKEYRWRRVRSRRDVVNLMVTYGSRRYAVAYAWAEIEIPEARSALLGIGSDDAVKVWLNGELIHKNWTVRTAEPDDDVVLADFQAGRNRLLLKVQNGKDFWGFACRLLDAEALTERLEVVVSEGDADGVRACLSNGADPNTEDRKGFTPLHVARIWGYDEIVQLLLDHGADPNVALPEEGTPLGFLDILWNALEENYPMMEYAGAFDDSWYESCKDQIKDVTSLGEALPIMDRMLVQRLNDYHTNLIWDRKPHPSMPPVRLGLVEDQIVVIQCGEELGIAHGDIVLEIDSADAKEQFDSTFPGAFGATKYVKVGTACRAILEGQDGSEVELKLRNREGEVYEVLLTRGGHLPIPEHEGVLSSRVIDDNIGYIRIRGWHGFGEEAFDKLLEPFRDKPCLIIDVRDNGGGSDRLAETVIGRFIDDKVLCSVSFQRQSGTEMYEKLIHIAEPRGPWRYEGKVAVLTNEGCASACEHFVSGMFEAGAILVGRPTTGACGWSQGIELPCGVTLACSLTFPLHGKVPSPLHGIEPHHLVESTIDDIRSGRDPILEKAKALLSP